MTKTWEYQFIRVHLNDKRNVIIGNVYRPPRDLLENYNTFIVELGRVLRDLGGDVIISGDFNIDLLKIREKAIFNEFLELFLTNSFIPKITLPTRLTRNNGTLIDNQFCKISKHLTYSLSAVILCDLSDHLPYFTCFEYTSSKQYTNRHITYSIQHENAICQLKNFLNSQLIENKLISDRNNDPNYNYEQLHITIQQGLDKFMPLKTRKFSRYKHKISQWITPAIIRSIKFRDKLYKKIKLMSPDNPLHQQLFINLKTYNKILKKIIREAKKVYYESLFSKFKNDIKNTWMTIKTLISSSIDKNKMPDCFNVNNKIITDSHEIAEEFNNFFINIGPKLASQIPQYNDLTFQSYLNSPCRTTLNFNPVQQEDVTKIINELKSKSSFGFDRLSTKLLKCLKTELSSSIAIIINQSLTYGIFPDKLKVARVIPVFKSSDETLLTNYRPISLLPSISKVFEKVIFKQLHSYFKSNSLYFMSQYGFREQHSTELAALELVDKIIFEMDKGNVPVSIFIDLSKAFDTIDHNILIEKLKYYGVRGQALTLLKSYLSERTQYTEFNSSKSEKQIIKTGVPQGSILGPLLFIIYINDLSFSSTLFKFISYADDTTLLITLNPNNCNPSDLSANINNELKKVSQWLNVNKLSLNIKKSKCMAFHKVDKRMTLPNLTVCNETIEYVKCFSFLGIIIDQNLTWKDHINHIGNKISKTIGILNRLKHTLPKHTLKTIYDSLINTYLNYGVLCWGFNSNNILKLQKRAVRILTRSKYNAHSDPLFKSLHILKHEHLIIRKMYKFYFRYTKNQLPNYFFSSLFIQRLEHGYGTRNYFFKTPQIKHKYAENCLRYKLPSLLNDNVSQILNKVNTHSEFGFCLYIKKYYINSYNTDCMIPSCYVCGRSSSSSH